MQDRLCIVIMLVVIFLILCKESLKNGFTNNTENDITDIQFEELIQKDGISFIMFYAPWCPHCTNLIGTWDELCNKNNSDKFRMARIDTDHYNNIGKKHNIKSFPTLKLFKNGEFIQDYKGGRNIKSMEEFINSYI